MLAQFMLNAQNVPTMEKLTNKCEVFNILVNTEKGHPALTKFVQTGGIGPILKMCEQIRENKVVTLVDRSNPMYGNDLQLFQKLVSALSNLPISARVLKDTKIGKGVNSIVKDQIFKGELINETGLNLVNTWKDLARRGDANSRDNSEKNTKTASSNN